MPFGKLLTLDRSPRRQKFLGQYFSLFEIQFGVNLLPVAIRLHFERQITLGDLLR
jgi:hypothetical protein